MTWVLLAVNLVANTGAHLCFKLSSGRTGKAFWMWQIFGNLSAFVGVLTFTALIRLLGLHTAFPLTLGLTALGVQVAGSIFFFKESPGLRAWVGTSLVIGGVLLIGLP